MTNPLNFYNFVNRRFIKLLLPFWLINSFYIVILLFIGSFNIDFSEFFNQSFTGGPNVQNLIMHQQMYNILLEIFGIVSIDGVDWFIHVTLISYLFIFLLSNFISIKDNPNQYFIAYSMSIIFVGLVFYFSGLPAHYYRNLWGLILGSALCIFENRISKRLLLRVLNIAILCYLIFIVTLESFQKGVDVFFVFSLVCWYVALVLLYKSESFFNSHNLIKDGYIALLGGISYEVYLSHAKFLLIERYIWGCWPSLLLVIGCTIFFSFQIKRIIK